MSTTKDTFASMVLSRRRPRRLSQTPIGSGRLHRIARERRWAYLGATEPGRVLFVVYTHRGRHVRVVTAREATDREKRRYRKGVK